jgi:hypothetical protein
LLELVRVGEVPHRYSEDDSVGPLKACRQLLDLVPDRFLGWVHRFLVYSFVLRPNGFSVKIRQPFVPHVQGVNQDLWADLAVCFDKSVADGDGSRLETTRRGFDVEKTHNLISRLRKWS